MGSTISERPEHRLIYTEEEKRLLEKLDSGLLDGKVGDIQQFREYRMVRSGKYIENGVPVSYKQGLQEAANNTGGYSEERFETDEQKLEFLQRYGWLIDDDDVKAYCDKIRETRNAGKSSTKKRRTLFFCDL